MEKHYFKCNHCQRKESSVCVDIKCSQCHKAMKEISQLEYEGVQVKEVSGDYLLVYRVGAGLYDYRIISKTCPLFGLLDLEYATGFYDNDITLRRMYIDHGPEIFGRSLELMTLEQALDLIAVS